MTRVTKKTKLRKHPCITKLIVSFLEMLREWNRSSPGFLNRAMKLIELLTISVLSTNLYKNSRLMFLQTFVLNKV